MNRSKILLLFFILLSCQSINKDKNDTLVKEEIKMLNSLFDRKIDKLEKAKLSNPNRNSELLYLEAVTTRQVANTLIAKLEKDTTKVENMERELLDFYFTIHNQIDKATNTKEELNLTLDMTDLNRLNHIRKILYLAYVSIELKEDEP